MAKPSGKVISKVTRIAQSLNQQVYLSGFTNDDGKFQYRKVERVVSGQTVTNHVNGSAPIALYLLKQGSDSTHVLVFDLDDKAGNNWNTVLSHAAKIHKTLRTYGFAPMMFKSGGGKGIHLWLVFDNPQRASTLRKFGKHVLSEVGLADGTGGVEDGHCEVFPKQDLVAIGGYGSAVALPLSRSSALLNPDSTVADPDDDELWHLDNPDLQFEAEDPPSSSTADSLDDHDADELATWTREALEHLDASDYDLWIDIGMILKRHFGDDGKAIWKRWSSTAANMATDEVMRTKWNGFDAQRATLRSLFYRARQNGWTQPASLNGPSWSNQLRLNRNGNPIPNNINADVILSNADELEGAFIYSEFDLSVYLIRPLPDDPSHLKVPRKVADSDVLSVQMILERYGVTVPISTMFKLIVRYAQKHPFHQIRDYLNSLEWDGVPRIDEWLIKYAGAEATTYNKLVGAKFLISAVARAFVPACKVDTALVLEGPQGRFKSTMVKVLAGKDYFSDSHLDMRNKDAAMQLDGKWIHEIAEMASFNRVEFDQAKAFFSRADDRYRPPFGLVATDNPRQSVMMGTCNPIGEGQWLKDPSGNRRIWPVAVTFCDIDAVAIDRDQIWAEATARYKDGGDNGRWWLTAEEDELYANPEQEKRREENPFTDPIKNLITYERKWMNDTRTVEWVRRSSPMTCTTFDMVLDELGIDITKKQQFQTRIGIALREVGFVRDLNERHFDTTNKRGDKRKWYRTVDDPGHPDYVFKRMSGQGPSDLDGFA